MSIRSKIILLVVVAVLVASGLVGGLAIKFSLKTLRGEILKRGEALTLALGSALREPLVVQDTVKVKEVIDSYGEMKGVILAAALSPDGDVLAVSPMERLSPELRYYLVKNINEEENPEGEEILYFKFPTPLVSKGVSYDSVYVVHKAILGGTGGHVYLALPTAFATVVKTQHKLGFLVGGAGLAMAVLVAILAAAIGVGLTRRILYLADVAERMSLGELDLPVEVKGSDELARLAEALERMRVSLKAAIERLKKRTM